MVNSTQFLARFAACSIAPSIRLLDGRPAFEAKAAGGCRELPCSRSASSSLPGTLNEGRSVYCGLNVDPVWLSIFFSIVFFCHHQNRENRPCHHQNRENLFTTKSALFLPRSFFLHYFVTTKTLVSQPKPIFIFVSPQKVPFSL